MREKARTNFAQQVREESVNRLKDRIISLEKKREKEREELLKVDDNNKYSKQKFQETLSKDTDIPLGAIYKSRIDKLSEQRMCKLRTLDELEMRIERLRRRLASIMEGYDKEGKVSEK